MSPNFLPQKMAPELAAESKFGSVGLFHALTVKSARQGINQVTNQQAVKFVAAVEGRNKVIGSLEDGAQQTLDPVRLQSNGLGRDDGTNGGTQKIGRGQNCPQRGGGRRLSGILRADAVQGA